MNKAFVLAGVTIEDYLKWCKTNKKASYKKESKAEFFEKIQSKKLIKDDNGNLVKKEK